MRAMNLKSIFLAGAKLAANKLPLTLKKRIYQITPLAVFIRKRLNRVFPHGIVEVEVAGGTLKGVPLALNLQEEKDYWLGTYETDLQRCIQDFVQPGWIVYDVGANIGYISLIFSKVVGKGGKVIAFEALPENKARFQHNIELNGKGEDILFYPYAIIDEKRDVKFILGPSNATGKVDGAAGKVLVNQHEIIVHGISLDDFIQIHPDLLPNVIKMDIEGGEVLALKGMQRLLREKHPLIFIEVHGEKAAKIVWDDFHLHHYQLKWMRKGYPRVNSLDEIGKKAYLVGFPP